MRRRALRALSAPSPLLACVCGYRAELATPMPFNGTPPDARPTPGESVTACFRCGRLYQLSLAGGWEPFDASTLDPDQCAQVRRLQSAIHRMRGIPS